MSKKRQYTKEAIDNAVNFVLNEKGSAREASKKYGVPRSSIQFKIKNPETKFKSGPDPILSVDEENALCDLIITLAKRGFPRKKEDIQLCVQKFLTDNPRPNPFKDNKPGDVWFRAFLKRHPNISIRTSEGVTNASACVSEEDIRKWFNEIRQYINNEGLDEVIQDPTRIFNADETGFNICPKTGKVLAEKGSKNVYQIEKGSAKENITVLFTFSAAGLTLKPLIIYPYKRIPDRVTLSVPSGWGIGRSDSGWMTAAVFYDFISNCFYPQILANNITFPVILFVDGHKTHITIEVSELCRALKIHLIALYPNATRILQPADVAAFRPIKSGWKKELREWYAENNYRESLTKDRFAPLLKTVVEKCVKESTVINGFRVTGLFPFDENNVDYSKCIATKKTSQFQEDNTSDKVEFKLAYKEFCDIVGNDIIQRCSTLTGAICDENFKAIYKIWQKFHGISVSTQFTFSNSNVEEPTQNINNEELQEIQSKEKVPEIVNYKRMEIQNTETLEISNEMFKEIQNLVEAQEIDETELKEIQNIEEATNDLMAMADETEKEQKNDWILDEFTGRFITREKKALLNNSINMINKKRNEERAETSSSVENVRVCQKSFELNINEAGPSNLCGGSSKISIISNNSLTSYLKKEIPISPKRKGKRQVEKIPFALTSDEYLERMKSKNLKKQEEEAAKENRKRLREEKKLQKENNIPKKTPKNTDNNKGKKKKMAVNDNHLEIKQLKILKVQADDQIVCCDACLSPIIRRIIHCNQCDKRFHQNCIPSFHRMHIPEDDDPFLCHLCYHCNDSDSSGGYETLVYNSVLEESKQQGFR